MDKMAGLFQVKRFMSTATHDKRCKLLIVGAGAAGCSVAAMFARILPKGSVVLVEPSKIHYYQPFFTLIGGGLKNFKKCFKPMESVIPKNVTWIRDSVKHFEPDENQIFTSQGCKISYDFMVIALGIEPDYSKIVGLTEALDAEDSGVCTIYSQAYVKNVFEGIKKFKSGNMIFTHPPGPIKCAGAPQKIMHLADDYLRKKNSRDSADILFFTALPKLFSVQKYDAELRKLARDKQFQTNFEKNIVCVDYKNKKLTVADIQCPDNKSVYEYSFLHIAPTHRTPEALKNNNKLADKDGFLTLNKFNLQHDKYSNIFGIGDCTNLPTAKTAAAVAVQSGVLFKNLKDKLEGKDFKAAYNGYSSCPLVTRKGRVILAEFDYELQPIETFPFDQGKESSLMFFLKSHILPQLYWYLMLNGFWQGPAGIRRILHLGFMK